MATWWDDSSKERHGGRALRAEGFAINLDELRERLEFSTDRSDVAAEGASAWPGPQA